MRAALSTLFRRRTLIAAVVLAMLVGAGATARSRWMESRWLREGEAALLGREYSRSRELLGKYLEAHPDDVRARLLAARTARRLREYYEAREHLRLCREAGGDSEAIEVEEALILLQRGDDSPVEWLRRRAQSNDDLALVILEVLIQYDLDTSQLWQALDELTRYLAQRPDDLQARMGRAFVWERFQYFKDALEDYREAVKTHPENEAVRLHLAETLLVVGPPHDALVEFRWLAERWPRRPEVRLGLGRCHRQLGELDAARTILDGLISENPKSGEALWERGLLSMDEGKPSEAEPRLRLATQILPYDRRVHFAHYRCLLALNRGVEANLANARVTQLDADVRRLDQLRQEVMQKPGDAALRYEGATLFLRNGERSAAIRWLRMTLRLNPDHQEARKVLTEAAQSSSPN